VTFGLLGVINMAHGEMLMLGAYATYSVQTFFQSHLPGAFRYYLLFAVPVAFAFTAAVGMLLERTVIRFLYGRPLETLLATWGISLGIIQTVRFVFGAQNVLVANPDWLAGGVTVAHGLVVPWARIAVVGFVIVVALGVWFLLQRTSLGLKVRAVTQNRGMAGCLGISTSRIDTWWPRDHTVHDAVAVVVQGRVGGRIYERGADGVEHEWGKVTAWEPPSRLAYTWHIGRDVGDATDVEIRFVVVDLAVVPDGSVVGGGAGREGESSGAG